MCRILSVPTRSICAGENNSIIIKKIKKIEFCFDLPKHVLRVSAILAEKREFGTIGLNSYKHSRFNFAIYRAGMKLGESKFITSVIRSKRSQCIKSDTIKTA
jgi:hypothetical protein